MREKFGCRCWCGLRHCWRVVVAVSPWVFPGFARLGQLSQTSDRLYSCGFPDRQSRPSSATGAGGFEVLIANCKLQIGSSGAESRPAWTRMVAVVHGAHPKNLQFAIRTSKASRPRRTPGTALPVRKAARVQAVTCHSQFVRPCQTGNSQGTSATALNLHSPAVIRTAHQHQ